MATVEGFGSELTTEFQKIGCSYYNMYVYACVCVCVLVCVLVYLLIEAYVLIFIIVEKCFKL